MKKLTVNGLSLSAAATVIGISVVLSGCGSNDTYSTGKTMLSDGDITVPSAYTSWNKFVPTVNKAKAGQVRELYINNTGMQAKRGGAFPSGTVSVMEIYPAQKTSSGELKRGADGNLVKGQLAKIFVMQKGQGWGAQQPSGTIDNGDWLYGAYLADGSTPATKDFSSCRSCHSPLAKDDYIARYSEHFDTHGK